MNVLKRILTGPDLHMLLFGASLLIFGVYYESGTQEKEEFGRQGERRILGSPPWPESTWSLIEASDAPEGTPRFKEDGRTASR